MTDAERIPVVTVDGPSGSGKGTICQLLARELGWRLLDSGALYRLTAHKAIRDDLDLGDEAGLAAAAASLDIEFVPGAWGEPVRVLLDGEDVTGAIRTETCGAVASRVAALTPVRDALLQKQRDFQQLPGLIADGRDMGTTVFAQAPVKIFLTASAEERAKRRYLQLKAAGENASIASLFEEIKARDQRDMERSASPLKAADDAVVLDTTSLSIEEVVDQILALVKARLA